MKKAEDKKMVRMTCWIDEKLVYQLKVAAAKNRSTLQAAVAEAVAAWLKGQRGKEE